MNIVAVNLNKYYGVEDVVKEDIKATHVSYLLINGDKLIVDKFTDELRIDYLYVGFSPLSGAELVGLAALLSYLNNEKEYTIETYEEPPSESSADPLVSSLIGFLESSNVTKAMFHTINIADNVSNSYDFLPGFKRIIHPYFEFNKLIYSLYTTSLGTCEYKDMSKNVLNSLSNSSIVSTLNSQLLMFDNKIPEFKSLIACMDLYLKLASRREINALLFYVALFLNISSFNRNRKELAISYVFLQRSIETALIHYYLSSGILEINEYDSLCFKGERKAIQGTGELLNEYFSMIRKPALERTIRKLNRIRNCSIIAHGLHIPSNNEYDDLYEAAKQLIDDLVSKEKVYITFYQSSLSSLKLIARDQIKHKVIDYFAS